MIVLNIGDILAAYSQTDPYTRLHHAHIVCLIFILFRVLVRKGFE